MSEFCTPSLNPASKLVTEINSAVQLETPSKAGINSENLSSSSPFPSPRSRSSTTPGSPKPVI